VWKNGSSAMFSITPTYQYITTQIAVRRALFFGAAKGAVWGQESEWTAACDR
jgi:hypothetical protein